MKALLSLLVTCSLALSQDCWSPHTPGRYITGAQVSRLNHNYQANWSTSETPGAENWGGWQDIGQCENSSNTTADPCWTTFSEAMHVTGAEVSYLGFNYRANWITSETPGVENWGGWLEIGECNADPILLSDLSLSDVSIEEAAGDNAIIGYFSTNLGSSEAIVYRLVSGVGDIDNSAFYIQNNILRALHSFNYAEKSSRTVRVEAMAADGTIHTEQFTILIEQNLVTDELTDITITPTSISQFVIYSHDDLTINSKVSINGVIGTNSGITLADIVSSGWKSTVNGDIWANGTVTSNAEAELNGDIYAPGGISLGWAGNHTGEFHADISVPFITIPSKTIPVSEDNITIGFQEERLLVPGSYGDIIMSDGSSLILSAGVYNLNTLLLNSNGITVYCDIQPGEVVELNVNENLQLGSEAGFLFTNKFSPASLKIHTNQFSELSIPYASKVNGTITAPNTTVRINIGSIIYGAIYARKVDVGYDATIIRPPLCFPKRYRISLHYVTQKTYRRWHGVARSHLPAAFFRD